MSEVRWSRRRLAGAGWLRVAIGAGLASRPTALPRALGVDSATAARIGWLGTMLGVRDAALGAGLVHAVRTRRSPQLWLLACAVCDAVDAVAVGAAVARGHVRRGPGVLVAAAGAAGAAGHIDAYRELSG